MFAAKNIEDEVLELKQSLNNALQEIKKYKDIATGRIEEYVIPYNHNKDSDISTYYACIVNALSDSKVIYTRMIDELTNIAKTLETDGTDCRKQHILFTKKATINAKWVEHLMKEAVINLTLLNSRANKMSKVISKIQDIAEHTNLLLLHASIDIAKNGYDGNLSAILLDQIGNLAVNAETTSNEIEALIRN